MAARFARFAAARLAKAKLSNARIIHGDAKRLLAERVPDGTLAAVHVYFPDPWWKQRHVKRRMIDPDFVRQVERVLVPGGALHFWTDVEEYYRAALDTIEKNCGLIGPLAVPERPPEHELDYRTHFERRMRLAGQRVYRAEFRKRTD
jgi:tRNA (guanine-N7-)-methyltransferase